MQREEKPLAISVDEAEETERHHEHLVTGEVVQNYYGEDHIDGAGLRSSPHDYESQSSFEGGEP